jgi:hypothetical protein
MTAAMFVWMTVCAALAAVAVHVVQARLERWDHDRHADD